jgi:hypothetical protein
MTMEPPNGEEPEIVVPLWWRNLWGESPIQYPNAELSDYAMVLYWQSVARYRRYVIVVAFHSLVETESFPPAPMLENRCRCVDAMVWLGTHWRLDLLAEIRGTNDATRLARSAGWHDPWDGNWMLERLAQRWEHPREAEH